MIYVGCPYTSSPDKAYSNAINYVAELLDAGYHSFSPVITYHEISRMMPKPYSFWLALAIEHLNMCTCAVFLQFDGYEKSNGVKAEINFCKMNEIPYLEVTNDDIKNGLLVIRVEEFLKKNSWLDEIVDK